MRYYTEKPMSLAKVKGASSQIIFCVMTGQSNILRKNHPWDISDLDRNQQLLEQYPEWRERMPEMAKISPEWAAIVSRWDELTQAYRSEVGAYHTGNSRQQSQVFYSGEVRHILNGCWLPTTRRPISLPLKI